MCKDWLQLLTPISNSGFFSVFGGCSCFLVTYYFTQQLLSQYQEIADEERDELDEKVSTFVKQYGAYLQIHSCLAFSATVRAQAAITELLKAASYDPTHRDAVKEIQRGKTLTFYEAVRFWQQSQNQSFLFVSCLTSLFVSLEQTFGPVDILGFHSV